MRLRTLTLICATTALLGFTGVAGGLAIAGSGQHTQRGSVPLTGSPSNPAANPKTHTLYVPIQCDHASSCPAKPTGRTVDIVDTSHCNANVVSRCRVVGTTRVGKGPLAGVVDEKTDTIYVIDGLGAVSVLNGAKCNATVRTHCGVLATIKTPAVTRFPTGLDVAGALDPKTHTLYVASLMVGVYVINVANCTAVTTTGCHQHVRKVKDPIGADGVDVDVATNTVYAANGGSDTVAVIDGAHCDGSTGRGCGRKPRTITVGGGPGWVTVDQTTDTVYVANNADNTVSVINGAACNSTVTSGCHRHPRTVNTGGSVSQLALDESRHTLFALNQQDDTMSEINTLRCNGHKTSGCPARARNRWLTWNPPGQGENPNAFALTPDGTAYLVDAGGPGFLAAVGITTCDALTTKGCRVEAPSVQVNLAFPEVDPATDTIYAANFAKPGIVVLDGAKCNAHTRSGCRPLATIPFAHQQANLGAIDQATHTLYAGDPYANTVSAIDIKHCNAHDTSGCSAAASKITVGLFPGIPVLDPVTHTLYVPDATGTSKHPNFNDISVVDAATCNAQVTSGCGQTPARVRVGAHTFFIGLSASTNTVYAAVLGSNFLNNTVDVINGATCNATDHSGCSGAVVAKAKVGFGPSYVIADDSTHTVYVDNNADSHMPGTVSVIDSATCNGKDTAGCSKPSATVTVGRGPTGMALDTSNHRVYVADFSHAAVSIIDTTRCNASHPTACGSAPEQAVGSQPGFLFVNLDKGTVYDTQHGLAGGFGAWGIFPASP